MSVQNQKEMKRKTSKSSNESQQINFNITKSNIIDITSKNPSLYKPNIQNLKRQDGKVKLGIDLKNLKNEIATKSQNISHLTENFYLNDNQNNITNLYCGENSEIKINRGEKKSLDKEKIIKERSDEKKEKLESSNLHSLIGTQNFSCIKSGRRQDHILELFDGSNLDSILKNMASVQHENSISHLNRLISSFNHNYTIKAF